MPGSKRLKIPNEHIDVQMSRWCFDFHAGEIESDLIGLIGLIASLPNCLIASSDTDIAIVVHRHLHDLLGEGRLLRRYRFRDKHHLAA